MSNQREIAAALGLAQATVARALRGSPLVTAATRARVEEMARKMGYRPNPMVTALMEHIRTGKTPGYQGSIAILIDGESEAEPPLEETYRLQQDGFMHYARLRGYRTEKIYIRAKGTSEAAIDRILHNRGVVGAILSAPQALDKPPFQLKWHRYALAAVSYEWSHLILDRVSSNHRENVAIAFDELLRRGYRRIGISLPPNALNPKDSNWLAGYLAKQYHLPKADHMPVFVGSVATCSIDRFREWVERWRPDALLCLLGEELIWMKELNISPQHDMGLVCLNRPLKSDLTGINENNFDVGRLTCDMVITHIIHNERGLPAVPRLVLVNGVWMEGNTLPKRKPNKSARPR